MKTHYRRPRRTTIQLTSLLDLLFVMIFSSLLQNSLPVKTKEKVKETVKAPPVVKKAPKTPDPPKPKKVYRLSAKFQFFAIAENPTLPDGTYLMQGSFNTKTRLLRLGGVSWEKRPENYDMVPLSGHIDESNQSFRGRIEFQGCQVFNLKRLTRVGSSPISGVWEGKYSCGQGPTGLKLTID
jgi:hypothetical protein